MSLPKAEGHVIRVISLALMLAGWAVLAQLISDPETLPGPIHVAGLIASEAFEGPLFYHMAATLMRVLAAFVLAMSFGLVFGLIMGRKQNLNRWLDPWLVVFLNLPALVTIVLCYLWIGLNEVAAIMAVAINKIPMVTAMIREGARAFDSGLDDMSRIYRMPAWKRFQHVLLPQLAPHIAASARTGTALIWKIVLVVEFLGRSNGIGFQLHLYFQLFDVPMVLTYALSFVLVMLVIEIAIFQPWETRASRWRRA